jgi:radical SAM protein with 4Fe4S-binding SPASM domain
MAQNHRKLLKRSKLADVLPLRTPFVIHIDVSSACNFKCKFCFHSLEKETLDELGFSPSIMNLELFKLTVDKIMAFPSRLSRLCLIRHGEALLNKALPDMIRYAKASGVAKKINISTNGTLLTPEINRKLIDSGLDEMLVSVEALTNEKYKEICGADIDFDRIVSNIEHYYRNKKDFTLYVKIVDCALNNGDEEKFHDIFDNICDKASIEYITPCFSGVDYSTIKENYDTNIMGDGFVDVSVCPQPFFQMHIFPNGNISVCNADYNEKLVFGNVQHDSLVDVWNGNELNSFRVMQLKGERKNHSYCHFCAGNVCYTSDSDILDDNADKLLEKFLDV